MHTNTEYHVQTCGHRGFIHGLSRLYVKREGGGGGGGGNEGASCDLLCKLTGHVDRGGRSQWRTHRPSVWPAVCRPRRESVSPALSSPRRTVCLAIQLRTSAERERCA